MSHTEPMKFQSPRPAEGQIRKAYSDGALSESSLQKLLDWSVSPPDAQEWTWYFRTHCLVLGWLLLVSGILFFGAYNWSDLSRFAKFGLLQFLIGATFSAAMMRKVSTLVGETLIVSSATLVGALLAVYGQVYQTGADSYTLFLGWGLLILPWCVGAGSNFLWLLQAILINVTFALWWYQFKSDSFEIYALANLALNLGLAYSAELASKKLESSWSSAPLLFGMALTPITISSCIGFWEGELYLFGIIPLLGSLALALYFRGDKLEYMTLAAASLLTLGGGLLIRVLIEADIVGWFLIALGILGEISLAARWLRTIHSHNRASHTTDLDKGLAEGPSSSVLLSQQVGITESEAKAVLTADPGVPFYVHLLTGFGSWMASLFLIAVLTVFVSRSEIVMILVGSVLATVSVNLRPKVKSLFAEYACLCMALAAPAIVLWGATNVAGHQFLPLLSVLLSCLALYFYPDKLGRFLFANGVVISGYFLADDIGGQYLASLWLVVVLSGLVFLTWDSGRLLKSRIGEMLRPICFGFSTAFMTILFTTSWNYLDFKPATFLAFSLAVLALGTVALARAPAAVAVSLFCLSAFTYSVPGLMAAVLLSMLAYYSRFTLMAVLAESFLLAFGCFYYYQLDTSLLAKSSILVGSGLLLLFTRFLLSKKAKSRSRSYEE